ncbi:10604_t:CDS:2 [Dentiscutata erythropus]|uniref:10604_t:CDS:1 n=1 Tax=Dentiscutata erythropus TaxID=1348616 RepID=A0A9N9F5P6_9GLOM|nr:10604_t:CDS:2 [Dentiscutata erythropus]
MTTSISNNVDEIDNAKRIYNDINDYLDFLADVLQTEADESDEPISPTVEKFLKEYREYVSSNVPSPTSYSTSDITTKNSKRSSVYKPNLWKYSLMCENNNSKVPPKPVKKLSLPTTASLSEIDFDKQGFAMFSPISKPLPNEENNESNALNNNNFIYDSPSVQLLKQLDNAKSDQNIVKVDKSPNFLTKMLGENFPNLFGNKKTDADQVEIEKSNEVSVPDNNREAVLQANEPISLFEILFSLTKIGNISRADYLPSCVRWDQWDRWEFY